MFVQKIWITLKFFHKFKLMINSVHIQFIIVYITSTHKKLASQM